MNTRGKKIRRDRLAILLVLCATVITTINFGVREISGMLFHDPYGTYKAHETKGRDYGDIQQVSKEYENEAFVPLAYPAYEEKELDNPVRAYEKKTVSAAGKTEKQITSIDYDSSPLFDRYMNLVFHRHAYNIDSVQTHAETMWMLYDKKQEKQLMLEDMLRCEYPALVKRLIGEQGWKKNIKRDTSALSMTETSLRIHLDEKHTISIPYREYKKYIRLKNPRIPSLYQKNTAVTRAQPEVDPKKKMVAFTFDDGSGAYAPEAIDMSEQYDERATFFVLGQSVKANRDTVKEVYNRGFELGNHSWDHSMDLAASKERYVSVSQVTEDIYKVQNTIYAICGTEPQYFRPPYGAVNNNMLKGSHLGYAFWDIDTKDWSSKNAASVTTAALNGAKSGSIVILFRGVYEPSVESLRSILPKLKKQGYQFATYSTLMKYEKDYLLGLDAGYGISEAYADSHQICILFAGLFSSFVLY